MVNVVFLIPCYCEWYMAFTENLDGDHLCVKYKLPAMTWFGFLSFCFWQVYMVVSGVHAVFL